MKKYSTLLLSEFFISVLLGVVPLFLAYQAYGVSGLEGTISSLLAGFFLINYLFALFVVMIAVALADMFLWKGMERSRLR